MARDRASRPEATPLRLFVAIEIPADAKAAVSAVVEPWRRAFPKARWVPSDNWHVTLKFLGSTWSRLVPWAEEAIGAAAVAAEPFETRVTGVGAFPGHGRARVVWVGLDDARGAMATLAGSLDAALAEEFEPEKRAFRAHLTVARSEPPMHLPEAFAETVLESDPFRVDRLVLLQSYLCRPAPRYEPVKTYGLGE
ncbi:MAG: RNA 2',3'-cyclic phosphodiesterase [Actinomycetota bacterium]|nr:RNA 2',3'-cyclic phosphodiesterase [Actinomycetota bacterium]